MSLAAATGLGVGALALIFIAISALIMLRRVAALRRRVNALQTHPTLLALKAAQAIQASLAGVPDEIAAIRARSLRIAGSMAELLSASALLQLSVDRVSFATTLLLKTFVPTLRGSMADM